MAEETQDTGMEYDNEEASQFDMGDEGYGMMADEIGVVHDTLGDFLDSASVERVYGEPVVHGETLVIPAAEVMVGLGFGLGSGYGPAAEGEGNGRSPMGGGGGGGGGGRTFARPVALVVMGPQGVKVKPVVDPTKIVLAALATFGFMMAMIARIFAPRRHMGQMRSMKHMAAMKGMQHS
ncbi:MAG: hypothetical protein ACYC5O_13980 [Anaerolineae bacterium]